MPNVLIAIDEGGIATLTMNRPDRFNALDNALLDELRAALAQLDVDESCKALVITGAGRAFCAGADLNTFVETRSEGRHSDTGHQVSDGMQQRFNPLMVDLMDFPKPVVTAINGIAAGGGAGIALCADVVLCGVSGKFKFVQATQLGIVADLGANWLLPRIAGRGVALSGILLGETLSAERAATLGLIWEVVDDASLLARAQAHARVLAGIPRETVLATRNLVDAAFGTDFRQMLELERLQQRDLCARPELTARIESFVGGNKGGNKPRHKSS